MFGLFRNRTELFAFGGLLDAANGFSERLTAMLRIGDVAAAVLGAGGISVIGWFAFYAVGRIALEADDRDRRASGIDICVAAVMIAFAFVPVAAAGGAGLAIGGAYLGLTSAAGSRGRRVATLLLALTGPIVVGALFLRVFAPLALGADARMAAALIGADVAGNVVVARGATDGIYVAPGCSSLHNMSLAVLMWATVVQLLKLRVTPVLVLAGLLGALAMAAVNICRLAAIARFPASFHVLHDGYGADLIGLASLLAAGLVIGTGVIAATRAPA